jgi:hypothetical protein
MQNLPFEIAYDITIQPPAKLEQMVDEWEKINYNEHFIDNSEDIIKSRFPCGDYDHIPGLTEVFQTMALNLKTTPLDEWTKNKLINNHKN